MFSMSRGGGNTSFGRGGHGGRGGSGRNFQLSANGVSGSAGDQSDNSMSRDFSSSSSRGRGGSRNGSMIGIPREVYSSTGFSTSSGSDQNDFTPEPKLPGKSILKGSTLNNYVNGDFEGYKDSFADEQRDTSLVTNGTRNQPSNGVHPSLTKITHGVPAKLNNGGPAYNTGIHPLTNGDHSYTNNNGFVAKPTDGGPIVQAHQMVNGTIHSHTYQSTNNGAYAPHGMVNANGGRYIPHGVVNGGGYTRHGMSNGDVVNAHALSPMNKDHVQMPNAAMEIPDSLVKQTELVANFFRNLSAVFTDFAEQVEQLYKNEP